MRRILLWYKYLFCEVLEVIFLDGILGGSLSLISSVGKYLLAETLLKIFHFSFLAPRNMRWGRAATFVRFAPMIFMLVEEGSCWCKVLNFFRKGGEFGFPLIALGSQEGE